MFSGATTLADLERYAGSDSIVVSCRRRMWSVSISTQDAGSHTAAGATLAGALDAAFRAVRLERERRDPEPPGEQYDGGPTEVEQYDARR